MAASPDWYYHRNGCTACSRASAFLKARRLTPGEVVPASRKLGRDDARRIAAAARLVIVAKGKSLAEFETGAKVPEACLDAMLGPTGNLRAPTLVCGNTVLVGFDEGSYRRVLV
jgi:arsenate reductase-like glutaredoxin family protein